MMIFRKALPLILKMFLIMTQTMKTSSFANHIKESLIAINKAQLDSPVSNILESPFTSTEISKVVKALKRRKSSSHDNILNEHIIFGGNSSCSSPCYFI